MGFESRLTRLSFLFLCLLAASPFDKGFFACWIEVSSFVAVSDWLLAIAKSACVLRAAL